MGMNRRDRRFIPAECVEVSAAPGRHVAGLE